VVDQLTTPDHCAAPAPTDAEVDAEVDAVLAASRVLVAISAQSIAGNSALTLPQLRALVAVASHGTITAAALADALGVHASTATRLIERLTAAGLLDRRADPADRRFRQLAVSAQGRRLVGAIMSRRRSAVKVILARLSPAERSAVTDAFAHFANAGGEPSERALWSWGWQS
jgi:DNA-binding MarR family transcriptional regulator